MELAGGGSIDVGVGVSDLWQETGDTWHMTNENFFFYICATIRTHREIQGIPCAGFFLEELPFDEEGL